VHAGLGDKVPHAHFTIITRAEQQQLLGVEQHAQHDATAGEEMNSGSGEAGSSGERLSNETCTEQQQLLEVEQHA
jgi:hypothetical protein